MKTRYATLFILLLAAGLAACTQPRPSTLSGIVATSPSSVSTPAGSGGSGLGAPVPAGTQAAAATPSPTHQPTATATATSQPTPEMFQLTTDGCCVQPSWSPDSKQVLYLDKPGPDAPVGIYAVDAASGPGKPAQKVGRVAVYSKDRSLMAYPDKGQTLVEQAATGQKWVIPNNGQEVSLSPDNQRLAWTDDQTSGPYDQRRSDVYVAKIDGSSAVRVAHLYGGGLSGWLPNGRIILSGRPSLAVHERTLYVLDLGTQVTTTLATSERISGVSSSPDGTWVAYYMTFQSDNTQNGIWVQRTDGSSKRRMESWGAYQWRDGSHLLVIPTRASPDVPFEVWEVDAATGQSRQLTRGAQTPLRILNGDWRVSPDGKGIAYVNSADQNIWVLRLPQ